MRKLLTFIPIIFLTLCYPLKQLDAQVVTEIDSISLCYNTNKAIPVVVQNMIDVDSLRLVLSFNNNVVDFVEHFAVNAALAGGSFKVTPENDSIIISWFRASSASIIRDTLVWLRFKGLIGSSALHWNSSGSFYHTPTGNLIDTIFKDGHVVVDPKINVTLTELTATCASICLANYQADATGGTAPFKYLWNGKASQYDFIQKYLCSGPNSISITDTWGCKLDSSFNIYGKPAPKIKLLIEGNEDTTIFLQNPTLTFSYEGIVQNPNWVWRFGDGDTAVALNPVTHLYSRAVTNTDGYYDMELYISDEEGCDTTIQFRIPIKEAKLKIPGVVTPNGDGKNDVFLIMNENKDGSGEDRKITNEFQSMELVIFDRWGRKLYENSNYKSDWIAKGVPDGSYYYVLKTIGFYKTEKFKGSITILGSTNTF